MEKDEKDIKNDSAIQGFKIAFNSAIKRLDNEKIQNCLSINEEFNIKLFNTLAKCNTDNDVLILNSYLEQGIKLMNELMKRGEKDNG